VRIVREPGDAEDVLVETFWRAYRARARFDPSRSFGAWIRRIATNAALAQLRSMRRHPPVVGLGRAGRGARE
jgi:RNA polymerase sigma-70 factor (ECF subfamily)